MLKVLSWPFNLKPVPGRQPSALAVPEVVTDVIISPYPTPLPSAIPKKGPYSKEGPLGNLSVNVAKHTVKRW